MEEMYLPSTPKIAGYNYWGYAVAKIMKFRWILLLFFILIFAFQSKNILTFAGVELGAYLGFKELRQKFQWIY